MYPVRLIVLSMSVLLLASQEKEKPKAKLQGYDAISLPGQEVILKAKLEKDDFFHTDLEDQKVIFRRGADVIGAAITGAQGIARVSYRPDKEGTHHIEVAIDPGSTYQAEAGTVLLQAVPKERPILICDVDHTVADISSLKFLITVNEDVQPLPGAPEALKSLAETYQILYLTARDDAFMRKTKEWMEMHGLPRAPIFFWDFLGSPSLSHARFKKDRLADLKAVWPNIEVGVGHKKKDALAYVANGLLAYIFGDEDDLPEGTTRVSTWQEVLNHVANGRIEPKVSPPEGPREEGK